MCQDHMGLLSNQSYGLDLNERLQADFPLTWRAILYLF